MDIFLHIAVQSATVPVPASVLVAAIVCAGVSIITAVSSDSHLLIEEHRRRTHGLLAGPAGGAGIGVKVVQSGSSDAVAQAVPEDPE